MDKIEKFLLLLKKSDRQLLLKIFGAIRELKIENYDIKALQGVKNVYRLRKGNIRIIFIKRAGKGIILDVGFRKDIYHDL